MGYIREPEGVDFEVINHNPTPEDMERMRERIREDKEIRASNPSIFSFNSYQNGQPTEKDFVQMSKELERLRKELHAKARLSLETSNLVKPSRNNTQRVSKSR